MIHRCRWCDRKMGWLPAPSGLWAVLICGKCDYDHDHATVIPREYAARDEWTPPSAEGS